MDKDFEAVILSACRTPIGAFGGALKDLSAVDLGAIVVREALSRAGVQSWQMSATSCSAACCRPATA